MRPAAASRPAAISRPATAATASGWLRAGALALTAHALLVLGIGVGAWSSRGRALPAAPSDVALPLPMIDLALADELSSIAALPLLEPPPPLPTSDAPASPTAGPAIPKPGPEGPRAPASDSGAGAGRPSNDVAWRRDRSLLRDRLTDGADRYQPAHSRTAFVAASPQADRREPTIGPGTAPRSVAAAGAPPAISLGMPDPSVDLRGAETSVPGAPAAVATPTVSAPGLPTTVTREGPLDVAAGPRAFDVEARGRAADVRSIRAASAERHPSVTDLSAPAAPGSSDEGHGLAVRPGIVVQPVSHSVAAPSAPGHLGPLAGTAEGAARERAHAHYESEIRERVRQALVFPRALAIRLLLGETMLSFAVAPDGRVDGPILVTKSAGYDEFDRAAVDAVRRAAPFPPLPREVAQESWQARSFSLRVTFSNPVIR